MLQSTSPMPSDRQRGTIKPPTRSSSGNEPLERSLRRPEPHTSRAHPRHLAPEEVASTPRNRAVAVRATWHARRLDTPRPAHAPAEEWAASEHAAVRSAASGMGRRAVPSGVQGDQTTWTRSMVVMLRWHRRLGADRLAVPSMEGCPITWVVVPPRAAGCRPAVAEPSR